MLPKFLKTFKKILIKYLFTFMLERIRNLKFANKIFKMHLKLKVLEELGMELFVIIIDIYRIF